MNQLKLLKKRVHSMWKLEAHLPPQERELHMWQTSAIQGGVTYIVGKGGANTFFVRIDESKIKYMMPDECFALIDKWIGRTYVVYAITKSKQLEAAKARSFSLKRLKKVLDDEYVGYHIVGFDSQGDATRLFTLTSGLRANQWVAYTKKKRKA